MASSSNIGIAPSISLLSMGDSFDRETRSLLRSRLLLIAVLGAVISIVFYVKELYFGIDVDEVAKQAFTLHYHVFFSSHLVSCLLGLLAVFIFQKSAKDLYRIGFVIVTFNIVLIILRHTIFVPADSALFILSAVMFIYAAFIPSPMRFQITLTVVSLSTYLASHWILDNTLTHLQDFWAARGGEQALLRNMVSNTISLAIICVICMLINNTLYSMRQKLHKLTRMGNYIIKEKLGEGGMGKVYVGRHALLCRPTAIKVMTGEPLENPEALARFEREVRLSSLLTHPNTITLFDFGRTEDKTFYYAMEFLEGMDLQQFVEKFGPMEPERLVFVLKQVCGSLAEAHTRHIVHRDIKPSNIFLTHRGGLYDFVKVLDFGLAKLMRGEDTNITKTGGFLGTPRYVAPESIYGNRTIDLRADIYNLGAVAYCLLTGQPLFAGSSTTELIVDHVKTIPQKPSELSELEIPPVLDGIIMKCLEKDPDDRYQSADLLREALETIEFDSPWTFDKACEWWTLHVNLEDQVHICPVTGDVLVPLVERTAIPAEVQPRAVA